MLTLHFKIIMKIDNICNHKFIVFCKDHYNPLGLCRSITEEGINPIVILIGENPILVNHSNAVKELYQFKTPLDGLKFIIENYGDEQNIPFLITCQDDFTEFLDDYYDEIVGKFYFFNDGNKGAIKYNNQKKIQCEIAESCGIRIPKGQIVKKGELPKGLTYPVLTKVTMSTKGAWKDDVHICYNEAELLAAWSEIKADEMLVQEYIIKKNEICIDGFSINGGEDVFLSYTSEYIRFPKDGFGNYMWMREYKDECLKEKMKSIIKKTGYTGIFCMEFLIDKNDNVFFLECNYRYSGWGYAHTRGGVNLPILWARSLLQGRIDRDCIQFREAPFTAMAEFNDYCDAVKYGNMSFPQWFKEFLKCDVHYVFNKNDKLPFFYSLTTKIMKPIVRLFK